MVLGFQPFRKHSIRESEVIDEVQISIEKSLLQQFSDVCWFILWSRLQVFQQIFGPFHMHNYKWWVMIPACNSLYVIVFLQTSTGSQQPKISPTRNRVFALPNLETWALQSSDSVHTNDDSIDSIRGLKKNIISLRIDSNHVYIYIHMIYMYIPRPSSDLQLWDSAGLFLAQNPYALGGLR